MLQKYLAYNIGSLVGAAFVGGLKPFEEHFPPPSDDHVELGRLSADGAKMLGALFKLKSRGVSMTVEKISLH